jgi:hypothetical protein
MSVSTDQIRLFLDASYPRAISANSIATSLRFLLSDVQIALNSLVVMKKAVQIVDTTDPTGNSKLYYGDIYRVKAQLDLNKPKSTAIADLVIASTTASDLSVILGIPASIIQPDLDRLVVLSQAQKIIVPITGLVRYATTTLATGN